jgi:cellulose synthase/poly-beta-1,6-N-acetylglucosamine synthase-like glycosyltransferase
VPLSTSICGGASPIRGIGSIVDVSISQAVSPSRPLVAPPVPDGPHGRGDRVVHAVAMLTVFATAAYLIWRAGWTLDGAALWIALPFLIVELHNAVGLAIFSLSLWDLGAPPQPRAPHHNLRVAVVIPTYNEPPAVLMPTIAASVALEPAHETWVLDDGRRPEIQELAERLGARYLTRPDNSHAKAGNLNNALRVIDVDVFAVLDADHVPLAGFLTDTLSYFDDHTIAVVQTPQDFYNVDSFEHEKDSDKNTTFNEQAVFYRAIGPGKNRWHGAFWCGTCALVRVAALREVGGVATETLTEDIHTTIRLQRKGWSTVYHNDVVALGLAAADANAYMLQRRRWAAGAMQVLRKERPLTGRGLSFGQRLAYAATLFAWFDSWRTLAYQLIPVVILLTGAMPVSVPMSVFGPAAVTLFVMQFVTLRLLARGYYPPILSLIFEMLRLPAVFPATFVIFAPGRAGTFRVTPKGRTEESGPVRAARVPRLYLVLMGLAVLALAWAGASFAGLTPTQYDHVGAAVGAAAFLLGNQLLVIAAIRRIRQPRYAGERRASYRFPISFRGRINGLSCVIDDVSLTGAQVHIDGNPVVFYVDQSVHLEIDLDGGTERMDCVVRRRRRDGALGLSFEADTEEQVTRLALALFQPDLRPAVAAPARNVA